MRRSRHTLSAVLFLFFCQTALPGWTQLGFAFNIKKPEEYDERVLRSEKSDQGRFGLPKRFLQNTFTHFNYYFNANNKLNEVLQRAKESFKEDYAALLPFYNYTLDATAADSVQLDSITYKASTGIALHDLRGDWVDNLYLLWGAAFYLQKKFDSAYLMFQFINYAFAPKEKDGYYRTIGSARDGNSALSIATREKRGLPKKLLSLPPSRNDAFIWQIRTFLAQEQYAEAASLIVTLRDDPAFPKRLINDLHEVRALWFYRQGMWDSAAVHLVQSLSNTQTLQEKTRWEFLAGQLFERAGRYPEAEKYYNKVIGHTTDLVLEIYARLATIRTNKDQGPKSLDRNVEELLRMAKRDKYLDYQDIIYYMAAQMRLEAGQPDAAIPLLRKSTQVTSNNPSQRNKAFLQLGELLYAARQYRAAYACYDSLDLNDPTLKDPKGIQARKKSLEGIAFHSEVVYRQDSLQRIAGLPEEERRDVVKNLVKTLRRLQGLKDDRPAPSPITSRQPADNLFAPTASRGEWYFYNAASRTRGYNEFRSKWGNRPNTDNWRRMAAIQSAGAGNPSSGQPGSPGGNTASGAADISFESLYEQLPLTTELLARSNDSIQQALYELGKAYIQEVEDCKLGTETLETLRKRFPAFQPMEQVLFSLYYCYRKQGENENADRIKGILARDFPASDLTRIAQTGKNPAATQKNAATQTYERIYDLFIEGRFEKALTEKKTADSLYGTSYWTPQLLYIEAVYLVRQRNDSAAIRTLNDLIKQFSDKPLAEKARNLVAVLYRRADIEEELRRMEVTRATDSTRGRTILPVQVKTVRDTTTVKPLPTRDLTQPKPKADTVAVKPIARPEVPSTYTFQPDQPHYVVVVLNKVDPVFVNEARNAFQRYNREAAPGKNLQVDLFQLDTDNRLLLIAPFPTAGDAVLYMDRAKPRTSTEILPWLRGGKYSYLILSDPNFNILKGSADLDAYRKFLDQNLPGKFQ